MTEEHIESIKRAGAAIFMLSKQHFIVTPREFKDIVFFTGVNMLECCQYCRENGYKIKMRRAIGKD